MSSAAARSEYVGKPHVCSLTTPVGAKQQLQAPVVRAAPRGPFPHTKSRPDTSTRGRHFPQGRGERAPVGGTSAATAPPPIGRVRRGRRGSRPIPLIPRSLTSAALLLAAGRGLARRLPSRRAGGAGAAVAAVALGRRRCRQRWARRGASPSCSCWGWPAPPSRWPDTSRWVRAESREPRGRPLGAGNRLAEPGGCLWPRFPRPGSDPRGGAAGDPSPSNSGSAGRCGAALAAGLGGPWARPLPGAPGCGCERCFGWRSGARLAQK